MSFRCGNTKGKTTRKYSVNGIRGFVIAAIHGTSKSISKEAKDDNL